jgi:dTDP-4-dehydrorhamnose reductase
MENILVLGSGGMLGFAVSEYYLRGGYGVKAIDKNVFNVLKNDIISLTPEISNADVVINCIGIIKQVIDNVSAYDVLKINGAFPRNLAKLCKVNKTPLIHITTDCAYSGKKGKYDENDLLDAEDLYGISKIAGETNECLTLRTSIIGPEKETNVSLLNWAFSQKGGQVNGFTNHYWNGVTTLQFAKLTEKIILDSMYEEGLFHLHSPDTKTKSELLHLFNDTFGLNITINPVEADKFCDRSLSSIYPLSGNISKQTIAGQLKELKEFFTL